MRKVATATTPDAEFLRAMIYDSAEGAWSVYLFLFRSLTDGPCDADYLYEDVAGAERHAAELLGVRPTDWQPVPDPEPGCQDDWIAPVRLARDTAGQPVWERFERSPEQRQAEPGSPPDTGSDR